LPENKAVMGKGSLGVSLLGPNRRDASCRKPA
jgi:hypothetical protein